MNIIMSRMRLPYRLLRQREPSPEYWLIFIRTSIPSSPHTWDLLHTHLLIITLSPYKHTTHIHPCEVLIAEVIISERFFIVDCLFCCDLLFLVSGFSAACPDPYLFIGLWFSAACPDPYLFIGLWFSAACPDPYLFIGLWFSAACPDPDLFIGLWFSAACPDPDLFIGLWFYAACPDLSLFLFTPSSHHYGCFCLLLFWSLNKLHMDPQSADSELHI